MTEEEMYKDIDDAIIRAERLLSMIDAPDPEEDEEGYMAVEEQLFHCSTCTVREVMEVIWPSVQVLIDSLKNDNDDLRAKLDAETIECFEQAHIVSELASKLSRSKELLKTAASVIAVPPNAEEMTAILSEIAEFTK